MEAHLLNALAQGRYTHFHTSINFEARDIVVAAVESWSSDLKQSLAIIGYDDSNVSTGQVRLLSLSSSASSGWAAIYSQPSFLRFSAGKFIGAIQLGS